MYGKPSATIGRMLYMNNWECGMIAYELPNWLSDRAVMYW